MAPRRRPPKSKPNPELVALHDRIREAEKAQAPVGRELVALDKAALEVLTTLVERGAGKKQAVLARALAVGLQGLEISTRAEVAPAEGWLGSDPDHDAPLPIATVLPTGIREALRLADDVADQEEDGQHVEATSLAAAAVGGSFAFTRPRASASASVPPSQRRRARAHTESLDDGTTVPPEE